MFLITNLWVIYLKIVNICSYDRNFYNYSKYIEFYKFFKRYSSSHKERKGLDFFKIAIYNFVDYC